MYTYQSKVHLHDTDAAGLLFFANQFKYMHDAYEALMDDIGFGFRDIFEKGEYLFPIVHANGDYKRTLYTGDVLELQVTLKQTGKTSFTLSYEILRAGDEKVGFGETVHATINARTKEKAPLPDLLREKLQSVCGP